MPSYWVTMLNDLVQVMAVGSSFNMFPIFLAVLVWMAGVRLYGLIRGSFMSVLALLLSTTYVAVTYNQYQLQLWFTMVLAIGLMYVLYKAMR